VHIPPMISKVGFLTEGIEVNMLNKYIITDSDMESLRESLCETPNVLEESCSSDYDDEKIFKDDIVLYCTVYDFQMESSYLEFHVYSKDSELFLHHDVCVFADIYDACNFRYNNEDYVALALGSNKIEVYSFMIRNPLQPVFSLNKHTSTVSGITCSNGNIFSCGYDQYVNKWDIETRKVKAEKYFNERLDSIENHTSDLSMISSTNGFILDHDLNITATVDAKNLTGLKIIGNRIISTDTEGLIVERDRRNIRKSVNVKKVHSLGINDFDIQNDRILTASDDETICVLNNNFDVLKSIKTKNKVFTLNIYPNNRPNMLFAYGGLDEIVNVHEL
ncbi:WD40 repeat-containing protein, partial [Trachipleistophora hominis]